MHWIKRLPLANIGLLVSSVLICLIIGEFAVRFFYPRELAVDPVLGYTGTPGSPGWDANGFRNSRVLEQADIVALGDSQTQGNNAETEEAWPQVLGRLATTTVYQMAVGGFGPVQEAYLIDQALALRPRLVILAPYLGNDFVDAYRAVYHNEVWKELRDPNFVPPHDTEPFGNVRAQLATGLPEGSLALTVYKTRLWIRNHVRLYELAGNATRALRERIGVAKTMSEKREAVEAFARDYPEIAYIYETDPRIKTVLSPAYRFQAIDLDDAKTKEGWRIAEGRYRVMKEKLAKENVAMVVALIPTKELVYLAHMQERGEGVPKTFAAYWKKETALHKAMQDFFEREGVHFVSLREALAGALGRGIAVYGQTMDGHPLPVGYAVIAEEIYRQLHEKNFYDPGACTRAETY